MKIQQFRIMISFLKTLLLLLAALTVRRFVLVLVVLMVKSSHKLNKLL